MSSKPVRTTVTLDPDVIREAKEFAQTRGISFREGLNELVRIGYVTQCRPVSKSYTIKPRNMGYRPELNYDNIGELLDRLEGPLHR